MFKYFTRYKAVDYITVLSGDTVSSTFFNSFFAEYEARVTNKDNNKLINRNNPMELNEHLKEVVNNEVPDCAKFRGRPNMSYTNSTRHKSKDGETHCEQISQATYIKTEDLLKEIKEKNKLDDYKRLVWHYAPNLNYETVIKIAEEIYDILSEAKIATKKLETEKSKFIPGAIYKQDDKGTFNLVSKPSKKFKKEQLKTDKVEDKYKPTDCILDEIHTGFFAEKEDDMNRMVEEEIGRQEFETKAKHEYTGVLKTTGMFFVWYLKLTGDWEKDKTEYLDIYKILVDMRKTYKEEQANYHQVATDKEHKKGNITTSSYTKPVCKIDPKEYNKSGFNTKTGNFEYEFKNKNSENIESIVFDPSKSPIEMFIARYKTDEKPMENTSKEYNIDLTQKEIDRVSSIAMESLQRPIDSNFSKASYQEPQKIGIKNNKNKPSLDIVINKQFPNALQLIALATEYGHNKYLAKDELYDNFRNVEGGSQTYFDAAARHNTDRNGVDNESGLPHIIHASWGFLAGLELWAEENNIDIKDFSENYMKNLNLENAK